MANLASLGILAGRLWPRKRWIGRDSRQNVQSGYMTILKREPSWFCLLLSRRFRTALQDMRGEAGKVRKFAQFTIGNLNRSKRKRTGFLP